MSYILEFPPLQINANVFQYFCRDYLVVLKNTRRIIEMSPIENKSHHFLSLFVGVLSDRFYEK